MNDNHKKKLALTRLRVQKFRAIKKLKNQYHQQENSNHPVEYQNDSSSLSDVNVIDNNAASINSDSYIDSNDTSQGEIYEQNDNNNNP